MRRPAIRAITPILILAAGAGALAWVWLRDAGSRQQNVIATMGVALSISALLVIWALALSGLRARWRLSILLLLAAGAAAFLSLFRVRGFSGDLVPIVELRSRRAPGDAPPPASPTPATPGGVAAAPDTVAGGRAVRDFPQFRGPGRDGVLEGIRLSRDWNRSPPRLLWKIEIGAGWSGFAVAGDAVFTQEQRGEMEVVSSYALSTGEPRWTVAARERYETAIGGVGPRATPTVSGERVYAMGATGLLSSIERSTGRVLWQAQAIRENGGEVNEWGASSSPLVHGRLVIVSASGRDGRSMVAYDLETGKLAWAGGKDRSGYSSPVLAEICGAPQVLVLNHSSVASHSIADGSVLWRVPWPGGNPNVAQPLPLPGDRVLVSSGYGVGSALYRVERSGGGLSAKELWRSKSLKAKFANFVARGEHVYGLDDGILVCLDLSNGERKWKAGRYGHGQLLLVDDVLLVTTESGDGVLVEASPDAHRELTRYPLLPGKLWNPPALAPPFLLVRNDEEAACYEVTIE
jgi:outer membrane protein assembly factor BamB